MSVTIEINRFDGQRGSYNIYRKETVSDSERDMLLTYFVGKPAVEGFYQYCIPLPNGSTALGYTLNPDLINYIIKPIQK